jgi:predicted nucleic acid-binding protein
VILLDTNVISEPMKRSPSPVVVQWLDAQRPDAVYLSSVTVAEIHFGIAALPEGRRRDGLRMALQDILDSDFSGRIWSFDLAAALHFGDIAAARRSSGHPISVQDCQIAAIARANGAGVATRNTADFIGCGIEVVNPWNAPGI